MNGVDEFENLANSGLEMLNQMRLGECSTAILLSVVVSFNQRLKTSPKIEYAMKASDFVHEAYCVCRRRIDRANTPPPSPNEVMSVSEAIEKMDSLIVFLQDKVDRNL